MPEQIPPPGSKEAIALGCLCPELDNGRGKGSGHIDSEGNPMFWISFDCPVHMKEECIECKKDCKECPETDNLKKE